MRIVERSTRWAEDMAEILERAQALQSEIASLGGVSAQSVQDYFLDENGDPRTDLALTHAQFSALFTTAGALVTAMGSGHGTNIYSALQRRGVPR